MVTKSTLISLLSTTEILYSTAGVHPTRCDEFEENGKDPNKHLYELLQIAQKGKEDGKIVAIGECGLDYDRLQFCKKEVQLKYISNI